MDNKLKPGERGFSFIILILGIGFFIESVKMFQKDPIASSYGALPLFLSIIIIVFMLKVIFIEDRNKDSENSGTNTMDKTKIALGYLFRKDIVIIFLLMLSYCVALFMGLGFDIATALFLFIAMTYLIGGQYLKNLIYTVLIMIFILLVFKTIFQIVLP